MTAVENSEIVRNWLDALEARHMANLRFSEVARALRALSSGYVERRERGVRSALDTAGKRAAFALFYAPLHFLITYSIVRALGADAPPPDTILDIGCGTGAAGAAWAVAANGRSAVIGIDRHPWAVKEAAWTYRQLGVTGRARRGELTRLPAVSPGSAVVAAYVLNELTTAARERLQDQLARAAERSVRVLVVEPVARTAAPWWSDAAARIRQAGGRADEWRFQTPLPPSLRLLDKAAGMDHRELTARSLYCPAHAG